jgi:hypothetical protein
VGKNQAQPLVQRRYGGAAAAGSSTVAMAMLVAAGVKPVPLWARLCTEVACGFAHTRRPEVLAVAHAEWTVACVQVSRP